MGDIAIYAVLGGDAADLRSDASPTFRIVLPTGGLQPQHRFVLAALAVRPNGTREILIGRGFINTPTDLPMDRRVRTAIAPAADQTRAPNGYAIYEVTPQAPLARGEYALVIYDREQEHTSRRGQAISDRFFDFGVGPAN